MVEIDTKELVNVVPRRFAAVFRNASLFLAAIYVLGFIYLKTYLALFGFQVELAGVSVLDLLLSNRYFVSQHIFVAAGILQAVLAIRDGWQKLRENPYSSLMALLAPLVILFPSIMMVAWSERGVPLGVHIDAAGMPLAFFVGWLSGWPCKVIHIDSHALLLHGDNDHRVVLREKLRSYRVK